MKKKNKLFPLVGGLTLVATVTPLATLTSCGTATKDSDGFVDLTERYTPKYDVYAGQDYKLTWADAMQLYTDASQETPDLFVDDYLWYSSSALRRVQKAINDRVPDAQQILDAFKKELASSSSSAIAEQAELIDDYSGRANYHKIKISDDITAQSYNAGEFFNTTEEEIEEEKQTDVLVLSFRIDYSFDYDYTEGYSSHHDEGLIANSENGYIELKNIPFIIVNPTATLDDDGSFSWFITPWFDLLEDTMPGDGRYVYMPEEYDSLFDWSISYEYNTASSYSIYYEETGETVTWDEESHASRDINFKDLDRYNPTRRQWAQSAISSILRDFSTDSHYLWTADWIKVQPERA